MLFSRPLGQKLDRSLAHDCANVTDATGVTDSSCPFYGGSDDRVVLVIDVAFAPFSWSARCVPSSSASLSISHLPSWCTVDVEADVRPCTMHRAKSQPQ